MQRRRVSIPVGVAILGLGLPLLTADGHAPTPTPDESWGGVWWNLGFGVVPELPLGRMNIVLRAAADLARSEPQGWRSSLVRAELALVDGRIVDARGAVQEAKHRCPTNPGCVALATVLGELVEVDADSGPGWVWDDPNARIHYAGGPGPGMHALEVFGEVPPDGRDVASIWITGIALRNTKGSLALARLMVDAAQFGQERQDAAKAIPDSAAPWQRAFTFWLLDPSTPPPLFGIPDVDAIASLEHVGGQLSVTPLETRPAPFRSRLRAELGASAGMDEVNPAVHVARALFEVELLTSEGKLPEAEALVGPLLDATSTMPRSRVSALARLANIAAAQGDFARVTRIGDEMFTTAGEAGLEGYARQVIRQLAGIAQVRAVGTAHAEEGWALMEHAIALAMSIGETELAVPLVVTPTLWASDLGDPETTIAAANTALARVATIRSARPSTLPPGEDMRIGEQLLRRAKASAQLDLGGTLQQAAATLGDDPDGQFNLAVRFGVATDNAAILAGLPDADRVAGFASLRQIAEGDMAGLAALHQRFAVASAALARARVADGAPVKTQGAIDLAVVNFRGTALLYVDMAWRAQQLGDARAVWNAFRADETAAHAGRFRTYAEPLYEGLVLALEGHAAAASDQLKKVVDLIDHAPQDGGEATGRRIAQANRSRALMALASIAVEADPGRAEALRDAAAWGWITDGAPQPSGAGTVATTDSTTVVVLSVQRRAGWYALVHDGSKVHATRLDEGSPEAFVREMVAVRDGGPPSTAVQKLGGILAEVPAGRTIALIAEPVLHEAGVLVTPVGGIPLAVRNPVVTLPTLAHLRASEAATPTGAGRATIATPVTAHRQLQPSFTAEAELQGLDPGHLYWDPDATVSNARSALAADAWVHISAHGRRNATGSTGLVLADGVLDHAALGTLVLPGSTVLLSSCDGSDWSPFGFDMTLLRAGARVVVATPWTVDAKAAAIWVRVFIDGMSHALSPARAAQHAYVATRATYPNAKDWAAFQVSGPPG